MKPGTKVKTPDGLGKVIEPIGEGPDPEKPILVRLTAKRMKYFPYRNFYYSKKELKRYDDKGLK